MKPQTRCALSKMDNKFTLSGFAAHQPDCEIVSGHDILRENGRVARMGRFNDNFRKIGILVAAMLVATSQARADKHIVYDLARAL
jgi:hypothetical protein